MDHLSAQLMQFLAPFLPYLLKGVKLAGQTVLLVSGSVIVTVYRNKINTIYLVITHIFCVPTFRQRSSLTTAYFLGKKQDQTSKMPNSLPFFRLVGNHQNAFS